MEETTIEVAVFNGMVSLEIKHKLLGTALHEMRSMAEVATLIESLRVSANAAFATTPTTSAPAGGGVPDGPRILGPILIAARSYSLYRVYVASLRGKALGLTTTNTMYLSHEDRLRGIGPENTVILALGNDLPIFKTGLIQRFKIMYYDDSSPDTWDSTPGLYPVGLSAIRLHLIGRSHKDVNGYHT